MAEGGSGGVGVLGVLVGALIVIVVGGGFCLPPAMTGRNIDREGRTAEDRRPAITAAAG